MQNASLDQCELSKIYKWKFQSQVFYVIPVSSVLGRLPVIPVGEQELFRILCAVTRRTFLERPLIQRNTHQSAADSGTSTLGPQDSCSVNATLNVNAPPYVICM